MPSLQLTETAKVREFGNQGVEKRYTLYFESSLRLRPAGTLSSLGVYSGKLQIPDEAFAAGIGDHRLVTTLCPGVKERMRGTGLRLADEKNENTHCLRWFGIR